MGFDVEILTEEERILFTLRSLYRGAGYTLYKMGKFEEYDLYARNKDFLISDNVITFTDAGGKLMALKPDVTLSIVRACRDEPGGGVRKLCYNENVYRVSNHGGPFRELTQAGLECIGDVGDAEIAETLSLAVQSLACVAEEYRLNVSHLGILSGLLDRLKLPPAAREDALRCVSQRNAHELEAVCRAAGGDMTALPALRRLLMLSGAPRAALPELRAIGCDGAASAQLASVTAGLPEKYVNLDFSIVSNLNYYNGVVFKGYVSGVPAAVLSGGQYDQLLRKLGRSARAIGFAVYVDLLERLPLCGEAIS